MERLSPVSLRRLVLGGALLLATLVALLPDSPTVLAAEPDAARVLFLAQNDVKAATEATREAAAEARNAAREATDKAREASREARRKAVEAGVEFDDAPATGGKTRKRIHIDLSDTDREYDSFEQFLNREPGLAGGVLGIVFIVFLTPILIIGLVIWFKLRKNRMQNETMLKLAEKGLVAPAEAMQAIGSGRPDLTLNAVAATAPLTEQARALRKAAAWSDLRKGVLIGAVGFAVTLFQMMDDGSPNWLGLVLMFVGIGYVVLWYLEDQQAAAAAEKRAQTPPPNPASTDSSN